MKANRYEVRIGKYGAFIYDNMQKYALPLDKVTEILNKWWNENSN